MCVCSCAVFVARLHRCVLRRETLKRRLEVEWPCGCVCCALHDRVMRWKSPKRRLEIEHRRVCRCLFVRVLRVELCVATLDVKSYSIPTPSQFAATIPLYRDELDFPSYHLCIVVRWEVLKIRVWSSGGYATVIVIVCVLMCCVRSTTCGHITIFEDMHPESHVCHTTHPTRYTTKIPQISWCKICDYAFFVETSDRRVEFEQRRVCAESMLVEYARRVCSFVRNLS